MQYGAAHTNGLYTVPNASGTQFMDGVNKIWDLGMRTLKIYCTPDYATNYPLETAFASPASPTTCTELCQTNEFEAAFALAWDTVVMTTFTFANGSTNWWRGFDGPTKTKLDAEYTEIYNLAVHLLTTYNDSGKRFVLQNWEGDWAYMDAFVADTANERKYVEWYAAFLAIRQKAVSDARRVTAHKNVTVLNAIEVNRVLDAMTYPHRPRILTSIAQRIQPDVVSYSAYDSTIADIGYGANTAAWEALCTTNFTKALRAIKRAFPGVPISIGEFGFPENEITNEQLNHDAGAMIQKVKDIALSEGCTWLLYWEVFDNETHGTYTYRGYWLRKPDNTLTTAGQKMSDFANGLA